jgi:hypothetical protein
MGKKQGGGKLLPLPLTTFGELAALVQGGNLLFALLRASPN